MKLDMYMKGEREVKKNGYIRVWVPGKLPFMFKLIYTQNAINFYLKKYA